MKNNNLKILTPFLKYQDVVDNIRVNSSDIISYENLMDATHGKILKMSDALLVISKILDTTNDEELIALSMHIKEVLNDEVI